MKKWLLCVAAMLLLSTTATTAQSNMTDKQLVSFITNEKDKGSSQSEIITKLLKQGVDMEQIQRVRRKYMRQIDQAGLGGVAAEAIGDMDSRMRKNNERGSGSQSYQMNRMMQGSYNSGDPEFQVLQSTLDDVLPADSMAMLRQILGNKPSGRRIFGHDIFNKETLSFEPNMNIATPRDYRLGPGDAVIIDIYGASQESMTATVSPDGNITISGFGPIQVSGLTVEQANSRVRSLLGERYSSSQIRLTLGQTRTIMVNVMGEVRAPGTYTLSAFATVFHAIYMAGGVTNLGTVRDIKVFRNNRQVTSVDIYDFILNGQSKGNVKLTDNDVIIVGSYETLVNISGNVKRPMYYEMKKDETLSSLIKYSGGFAGNAYRNSVRVMRKSGALYSVHTVNEFDFGSFHFDDGDSVKVDSIIARYQNTVEVKGAVFRPGLYQIGGDITTVRSLLEAAQGVTEDAFTAHAVMHRLKEDRTLEVLAVDIAGILDGRVADVPLRNEDVLYVPSRKESIEVPTLTIHGEVQYPGVYRYADNETIEDFVMQAGGLTDAASVVKVDVARRIMDPRSTTSPDSIARTYTFALKDGFVIDGEQAFHLEPFDEVYVRKSPSYSKQQNVVVEGEVLYQGTYTLSSKTERLSDLIKKVGGLKNTAFIKGARLFRQRTAEEQARAEALLNAARRSRGSGRDSIDIAKIDAGPTYTVGIDLEKAMAKPGCDADLVLRGGDRIVVPEYTGTVKVSGEVMYPNTISYTEGMSMKEYVNQAGGFTDNAKKRQTYIIYMNGNVAKAGRRHKPVPGCEIVVPTKHRGERLSTSEVLAIGTTTASIATMVATLVNLLK